MQEKLEILELFSDRSEAEVVKGFLETHGINAYVFNPDGSTYPLYTGLFQDTTRLIKLRISSSDLQEARKLLKRKFDE